ncbi:MAG: pantetheine-phosphate adenylyltransferase [Chloroflexi bacterium]|nr:pantetheine-phosphate adenylyltransferase [Chloroflexota bacterium]
MTTAIYPGSFDPITNGHLDIIKRASSIFEKVILGIYDIPQKSLLFSVKERVDLARQAVTDYKNVEVTSYSGITVEFARKAKAQVLVRGLRASSDFEREFEMALMNKKLAPDIELVCFMANLRYQFLSSSLLKEIIQLGGNLDDMVPPQVSAALKKKLLS